MVCRKGTQTQNCLQRTLRGCSRATKEKAYKMYVEPILNYFSTVWNPIGKGNQGLREQSEMVQRKLAHFVFSQWQRDSSQTHDKSTEMENFRSPKTDKKSDNQFSKTAHFSDENISNK